MQCSNLPILRFEIKLLIIYIYIYLLQKKYEVKILLILNCHYVMCYKHAHDLHTQYLMHNKLIIIHNNTILHSKVMQFHSKNVDR